METIILILIVGILIVGVDDIAELRGDAFVTLDQQLDGGVAARRRRILVVLVMPAVVPFLSFQASSFLLWSGLSIV